MGECVLAKAEYIGKETSIDGDVTIKKDVFIEGTIHGDLNVTGSLQIGENGVVIGNVHATHIILAGSLRGNLLCDDSVKVKKGATLVGDIHARYLAVDETSVIQGDIYLFKKGEAANITSLVVPNREGSERKRETMKSGRDKNREKYRVEQGGGNSNIYPLTPSSTNHFY